MPTDVRAQLRLAFKCLRCNSVRPYGIVQSFIPEVTNLMPVLECEWCGKAITHNYIGRKFFDVEITTYEDVIRKAVFTPRNDNEQQWAGLQ